MDLAARGLRVLSTTAPVQTGAEGGPGTPLPTTSLVVVSFVTAVAAGLFVHVLTIKR
jgi:hypothetical protein